MTGDMGWLAMPDVISMSAGQSLSNSSASASSSNESSGSTRGTAFGRTHGVAKIEGRVHGTSRSEGVTEGLEPVYQALPTSFHSKENVLYMAAHEIRSLKAGEAFVNYVDGKRGMVWARLRVPEIKSRALADDAFAPLRDQVLAASPSAVESDTAAARITDRKRLLFAEAAEARNPLPSPEEPQSFRVRAPKSSKPKAKG
jgi:hypothetical protein